MGAREKEKEEEKGEQKKRVLFLAFARSWFESWRLTEGKKKLDCA